MTASLIPRRSLVRIPGIEPGSEWKPLSGHHQEMEPDIRERVASFTSPTAWCFKPLVGGASAYAGLSARLNSLNEYEAPDRIVSYSTFKALSRRTLRTA